ncbi:MAG: glutamate 5-kinase [Rhizobiaceae bacterium]|nr:glutamate 5-kinase [Rhizobiaceae bacterium]
MVDIASYNRIVIKIGSALLVDRASGLKRDWLNSLADDVAMLRSQGAEVLLVSSGAIALGRRQLGLPNRGLKLEESQAAAATGQILLARAYSEALGKHDLQAGQVLLTLGDTEERRRYINARETVSTLLKLGVVPIINENDTVATSEIRYGDNDRLAARVATMVSADLLVLLSDVDGFYSGLPGKDAEARRFDRIEKITPEIEAMAGDAGTELSKGGMVTKLDAAKIATEAGTVMAITSGKQTNPLQSLFEGGAATWFDAKDNPVTARKKWIAGQMEFSGKLIIDDGAANALCSGKSLLPAGVREVFGNFARGDVISVHSLSGKELGCGISSYDMEDAKKVLGKRSDEIEALLGMTARGAMIHRDNLVLKTSVQEVERDDA